MMASRIPLIFGLIVTVLVGLSGVAVAQDSVNFLALQKVTGIPTALSDRELASIEGTGICIGCPVIQLNLATLTQVNTNLQALVAVGSNISQTATGTLNNAGHIGQINLNPR
jgi:hypothetical protein